MTLVIALALLVLAFYLLAVLTEEFFVPAIDKMAEKLRLSSDAAGATLLAVGSSAPEFFTSFFAIMGLVGGAHADVGAGTIVGSAIFNVLVIVGAAATFRAVKLQWQPFIRDMVFYAITILLLLAVFWDGKIVLWEALGFVLMYGVYVFTVVKWRTWLNYKDVKVEVDTESPNRNPVNALTHRLMSFFIPDPHKRPEWYVTTFIMGIAGIAALSWLLVEQVISIAGVLHINPIFLALTVLAAGTSVPDLIGSTVVARQGRGDMAVSNAIGSNIFDVLFCLGVPWLLVLSLKGEASVSVSTDNLMASVMLLFATVVATLFLLMARKWRLGRRSGFVLLGLYVAYVVYVALAVA